MRRGRQDALLLPAVATAILAIDQASKYLVTARLAEGQSWHIVPWLVPIFGITHVTNTGAAFGLLPAWGDSFIVIAAIVIVAIIIYYWRLPRGQWLMEAALGLQLGGAMGNLVDRLRQGFVVDFIDLNFWPLHNWPVFNLADSSIVAGATLLGLLMVWEERRERHRQRLSADG